MQLPMFYQDAIDASQHSFALSEETSRHCIQVLRMKEAEQLWLTNGEGLKVKVAIKNAHKKESVVEILEKEFVPHLGSKLCIGISPLKNTSRFEWFLEKAAELGITEIIPLVCKRTEKEKFRIDRLNAILISAMLQSQQSWRCKLQQPTSFEDFVRGNTANKKLIAHCYQTEKHSLQSQLPTNNVALVIGPEGDFTNEEVDAAVNKGFIPVSLGNTRLRTETAGIAGAVLLTQIK